MQEKAIYIDSFIRLALIAALILLVFHLLLPLYSVLTWGFILAIALYPIYAWLKSRLGNRARLSALIITLLSLLLIVGSLALLTENMINTVSALTQNVRANEKLISEPPQYIKSWPIIGETLYEAWSSASFNLAVIVKQYADSFLKTGRFLLNKTATITFDILLFMISVLFAGYLLANSESVMKNIRLFAKRLTPEYGTNIVNIVRETTQNVSRGVIGLALLQSLLLGLLLIIGGVPGAGLFTFISILFCIAQLGQFIIIIPVIIWLFFTKSILFASLLSIPLIAIGLLDNFLKPFILARGLQTPTIVIFLGVIGGIITHGVIGVFIGPVVLAVFYDLLVNWIRLDTSPKFTQ